MKEYQSLGYSRWDCKYHVNFHSELVGLIYGKSGPTVTVPIAGRLELKKEEERYSLGWRQVTLRQTPA
jgi:hypothetical protein